MAAQSIVLHNHRNGSDKIYTIELVETQGGWLVNYRTGRRIQGSGYKIKGSAGGTRTRTPRPHDAALRIYRRLVREQLAKHYVIVEQTHDGTSSGEAGLETLVSENDLATRKLPMLLVQITEEDKARLLCDNPSYCAQEEEHGERRMLLKEFNGTIRGIGGDGEYLALPRPIRNTPRLLRATSFLIDGELVGDTLRVWDLLEHDDVDLRDQPMQIRYEQLCTLIPGYYDLPIRVVATAFTRAEKLKMFEEVKARRGEGMVFKLVAAPYVQGTSKYGLKYTFRSTAVTQVVGANSTNRSIQMGLADEEGIRFIGNLPIPGELAMPPLGAFVEVEYLEALPEAVSMVEARYVGLRSDRMEADSFSGLKFRQVAVVIPKDEIEEAA